MGVNEHMCASRKENFEKESIYQTIEYQKIVFLVTKPL